MSTWEFHALNNIAEKNGWHQFISMQSHHSLLYREEEREMFAYCQDVGVGIIPWSPLARGLLARPYIVSKSSPTRRQETDAYGFELIGNITTADKIIISRVEELANMKHVAMAQIGISWSLFKGVNPILGLGSIERVEEAVKAVHLGLAKEDVAFLEQPYLPKAPIGEV